ncbi:MAG: NAD(P)-dependent oxidoreductase [Promethearchaeota archaeon]|jgi:phosphoglycerate dehydrogenase-like enzyme
MENLRNSKIIQKRKVTVSFISSIPDPARKYISEKLKPFPNVKLLFPSKNSAEDSIRNISDADILVGWRPSKDLLSKAVKAKLFINPGAGIQHLVDLFRKINEKRQLLLINGHGNSYFVAQHAVALLLTLMSKTIPHHLWMKEGKWRTGDEDAISIPLRFKKVGLFGYGAINKKIHNFLKGFDIEFSVLRKHWEKQESLIPTKIDQFEFTQLHDFLKDIDILFIATPLTSLTKKIIKKNELELLGKNGIIINVARGDIIDEESLYNALKERVIEGAAIDVWYDYSPKKNEEGNKFPFHFPFHMLDNIILSPHRGYSPFSDLLRWDEIIENIMRLAQGRSTFINVVNLKEEY